MRVRSLLVALVTLAPAAVAHAGPGGTEDLAGRRLDGATVVRRGTIEGMRDVQVRVAGQERPVPLSAIADHAFVEHLGIDAELGAAKGLQGRPRASSEVVQTEDATLLTRRTTITISDPSAFGASAGRFAGYGRGGSFSLASLDAEGRERFERFKAEAKALPAGHPLRVAADAGEDALVAAVTAGKGDVTVTTTIVVPADEVRRDGARARVPSFSPKGGFEPGTAREVQLDLVPPPPPPMASTPLMATPEPLPGEPVRERTQAFLTGFTLDDSFAWEERWDFPSGFVEVGAGAWYALGLRAPVEVTAVLDPARVMTNAFMGSAPDEGPQTTLQVSARTLDGDPSFYAAAGLPASQIYDGKELVIEAGAYAYVEVRAGWGAIKGRHTEGVDFDYGQHFTPPFGDCRTCGVPIWIPEHYTKTGFSLGKVVKGGAQLGFLVGGTGSVELGVELRDKDGAFRSWLGKDDSDLAKRHRVTLSAPDQTRRVNGRVPALDGDREKTRRFGYSVSNPRYTWDITVTPGIMGTLDVDASPFFEIHKTIGPFWLHDAALPIGAVTLPRHEGTIEALSTLDGVHVYQVIDKSSALR